MIKQRQEAELRKNAMREAHEEEVTRGLAEELSLMDQLYELTINKEGVNEVVRSASYRPFGY